MDFQLAADNGDPRRWQRFYVTNVTLSTMALLVAIMPVHARYPLYGFEALFNMCDCKTSKQIQRFNGDSLFFQYCSH